MDDEISTLEDFEQACGRHDLTYAYSDDGRWYDAGRRSEDRIRKAAEKFDRAEVERIWNAAVDAKMLEGHREQFYWRWPQPVA